MRIHTVRARAKASAEAKAICDSGFSDVVDVYDAATGAWDVQRLSVPRTIAVGASAAGTGPDDSFLSYALPSC